MSSVPEELIDCARHDVTGSVHTGEPDIQLYQGAVYIPRGPWPIRAQSALYDRSGRIIPASLQFHGHPGFLKTGTPLTNRINTAFLPHLGRAIYGGIIVNHFGHFITECLNCLWAYSKYAKPDDKVLFLSNLGVEEISQIPWLRRLLELCGVPLDAICIPPHPVIIDRLIVPGPAFCEDDFIFTEMAAFGDRIGQAARRVDLPGKTYWASKRGLAGGNFQVDGEDELEDHLQRWGVEIIRPEELDIDTQISLLRSETMLLGFVGSTFHTSLFAPNSTGIALSQLSEIRRSFDLMDAVSGARIDYKQMAHLESIERRPGFNACYALPNPRATAEAVMDLARSHPARRGTAHMSDHAAPPDPGDAEFVAYRLAPKLGGLLRADLFDGRLHVADQHLAWHTEIHLIACGNRGFLVADHAGRPALSIVDEPVLSPLLSYILEHVSPGLVALKSAADGRYLMLPPGGSAILSAFEPRDWEELIAERDDALLVQHAELVDAIRGVLFDQTAGPVTVTRAVDRLRSSQRP